MALDLLASVAGHDDELADARLESPIDDPLDEWTPAHLEQWLALRASGQAFSHSGRDDQTFQRTLSRPSRTRGVFR
jgi:hypothetical protein